MKCFYCNETIKEYDTYWIVYEDCEKKDEKITENKVEIRFDVIYDVHGSIGLQCEKCHNKK